MNPIAPVVAWDIETVPISLAEMTDRQKRRYEKLLKRQLQKSPEMSEEDAGQLVRSTHPMLGWICCISLVTYNPKKDAIGEPRTHVVGLRSQEDLLLAHFWEDVRKLPGGVTWVTFNGKRFDVPFIRTRTWAHGMQTGRLDLLFDYPYKHKPHCDLINLFDQAGLADVCELLGVESPKSDMDGSQVQAAIKNNRLDDVAAYCARDVVATLQCYLKIHNSIV